MYECVNPSHPDKICDRIGGALVDYAYTQEENPRVALEIMAGHGKCYVMAESSVKFQRDFVEQTIERISGEKLKLTLTQVPQDSHLANNQDGQIRCGDNGIFKGMPVTREQAELTDIAKRIYSEFPTDGKYILDGEKLIICQSKASKKDLKALAEELGYPNAIINPLGKWTGSLDTDTGCGNRKLGSDMGDSVTGGGVHLKDLSKADVSVNIACYLLAQHYNRPVEMSCAIGDTEINGIPYEKIVRVAKKYIKSIGGFEKFAEWGLIR